MDQKDQPILRGCVQFHRLDPLTNNYPAPAFYHLIMMTYNLDEL